MGQRSVSASNLAAIGNLPTDFLNTQAHRKSLPRNPITASAVLAETVHPQDMRMHQT